MKYVLSIFLGILITVSSGCEKESVSPAVISQPPDISTFSQLKIGNWWIYSAYTRDRASDAYVASIGSGRDTIYVVDDSLIHGDRFFVIRGTQHGGTDLYLKFWRDSADCIVNEKGEIIFSIGHFDEVFRRDTVPGEYTNDYFISGTASNVGTGVGTLDCYILEVRYNYFAFGERTWHAKFSAGYGLVKWREEYGDQTNAIEQRLMAFYIAP